jgi:hypothetical protein
VCRTWRLAGAAITASETINTLMMQTKMVIDQWRGDETRRDDVSALAFSV